MAMAVEVARTNISEFDKTVSMLENLTDEELQALRKVAMVITKRNADDRPIRKLTEEEFFLKVWDHSCILRKVLVIFCSLL